MADIYIARRVIDYVGLGARSIPEHTLPLLNTLQPTLALLQAMGPDGAKLVSVDALGNLVVSTGESAYTSDMQFYAGRGDFSNLFDDFGPLSGLPMGSQFDLSLIKAFGGQTAVWQPTIGNGAEFQTRQSVTGLPTFRAKAALPLQASMTGNTSFGIKQVGDGAGCLFRFNLTPAAFQIMYRPSPDFDSAASGLTDITGSLPGTYATAINQYDIIVSDDAVRFFVGGVIVATILAAQVVGQLGGRWKASWSQGGVPVTTAIQEFTLDTVNSGPRIAINTPSVSAVNTAQQIVIDLRGCSTMLDIVSVASAGTSTLQVEVSTDNANWTSIDTLAAALAQAKHYTAATVGATVAVNPLAFRFVRITAGAAGVGNTTTLTVSAK